MIRGNAAGVVGLGDEALGRCWSPGLWTAVILMVVVVVVLMGLLVVVTCTGGISILLVRQDWLRGPEVEGPMP